MKKFLFSDRDRQRNSDKSIDLNIFYNYLLSTPWGRESIRQNYLEVLRIKEDSLPHSEVYYFSVLVLYNKYVK